MHTYIHTYIPDGFVASDLHSNCLLLLFMSFLAARLRRLFWAFLVHVGTPIARQNVWNMGVQFAYNTMQPLSLRTFWQPIAGFLMGGGRGGGEGNIHEDSWCWTLTSRDPIQLLNSFIVLWCESIWQRNHAWVNICSSARIQIYPPW